MEEVMHILTSTNKVFSYTYTHGADLQPIINFFKKTEGLPILEIYIQTQPNTPMTAVTDQYEI